ncbi:hypothetical protein [Arthrobacter sp. SPG23]|uniref:hypothetical protein n=1 Tax=Arthrobacter sp. SPG23 TaxID=1610703 RepID=UPI000A4DBB19|nr:hypothetical protein [Arthrobacter sp. SPG23]
MRGCRAVRRRWRGWVAGTAVALVLAGCSPAPGGPTPGSESSSGIPASPSASSTASAQPEEAYGDQQLVDIATSVVQSRNLQGVVIDTRTLRSTAEMMQGPTSTSVTTPEQCAAFRLPGSGESDPRRTDTEIAFAAGTLPLGPEQSPTSTITFTVRSAPHEKLVAADFNGVDEPTPECTGFERAITVPAPGGGAPYTTTYTVQLVDPPSVGQKAYGTVQKAKGLGAADIGMAGMQVLAGTLSIDMALTLWPVNPEVTGRAMDSMAAFARDLIDEAVKNPPSSPQPNPAGARTPEELTQLLAGVQGPSATKFYVSPTEAGLITRTSGSSPLPPLTSCSYDDAKYWESLAPGATMAKGIASTEDKGIALGITAISTGTAVQPPHPFDTRTSAVADCTTIQANVFGQGALSWTSVRRLDVKLDAASSYAFSYQDAKDPGRWYVRLGARRGTDSVEVATMNWRPLGEGDIQPAVDAAATIIQQVFERAGTPR